MRARILLIGLFGPSWSQQLEKLGSVTRASDLDALENLPDQEFELVLVSGRPERLEELRQLWPHLISLHEGESEQALFLRSILDNLPHMVFVKDAKDLRFVRWNKAGADLVGISRAEMVGKTDYDLFPAEEAAFFQAKDREVLSQKVLHDIPEETLNTRHGVRTLHTKKIPICNEQGEPLYLLGISEDITEIKRLKTEAAARLEAAREAERRHIARELHDELGQLLTALKLDLGRLESQLAPDLVRQVQSMSGLLDHTIKTVRRLSKELRPQVLDDFGLRVGLEWLLEQVCERTRMGHEFRWELGDLEFTEEACSGLFRICQEALNNVARHSGADHVVVELSRTEHQLTMRIQDNGVGLKRDQPSDGLGLLGMEERAGLLGGTFQVEAMPEGGTRLLIHAPLARCQNSQA